jgi:hypothetical protein
MWGDDRGAVLEVGRYSTQLGNVIDFSETNRRKAQCLKKTELQGALQSRDRLWMKRNPIEG